MVNNWAAGKEKKEERTDEVDAAGLAEVQVRVKEGGLRRSNSKTERISSSQAEMRRKS